MYFSTLLIQPPPKPNPPQPFGGNLRDKKKPFLRDFPATPHYTYLIMMIWLIALVLFGVFGLTGYTLGAVRFVFSLFGLIFASILSAPLGHHFDPLLKSCGMTNPIYLWLIGPLVAGIVVWIIFNVIGIAVNQKVEVYYKYKAGDLQESLWKRLNPRLGLCLGLMNGAVSLILVSWVFYIFSYATSQMATADTENWQLKLMNSTGASIQSSGMNKVAAAVDTLPEAYYQCADIAGLIYHNDLLEGRLSRYPAFFSIAEIPQFKEIAEDKDFAELRQKQAPISEILAHPKAQAIMNNPEVLKQVYDTLLPNLADLQNFLKTGQSEKFDEEKILGRWDMDIAGTLRAIKRAKPNMTSQDTQRTRQVLGIIFAKSRFVAAPEPGKEAFLKDIGKLHPSDRVNVAPTVDNQNFKGTWTGTAPKYELSFPDKGQGGLEALVEGDHLTITGDSLPMVFSREY
jgi:hypothetical protein